MVTTRKIVFVSLVLVSVQMGYGMQRVQQDRASILEQKIALVRARIAEIEQDMTAVAIFFPEQGRRLFEAERKQKLKKELFKLRFKLLELKQEMVGSVDLIDFSYDSSL